MKFENKVCVITGGALGIGRCLTQKFARLGVKVAFADMDEKAGKENLELIRSAGGEALFFHGDIAEEQTLRDFVQEVVSTYGKVDYLVNNACLSKGGILSSCSYADFNYVLRVGVTAPYFLSLLLLPHFNAGASIINIASTRAFQSQADTESYTAAKGGISALTHALAASLAGRVRVNAISPGWIDTGAYHDPSYRPSFDPADLLQHPVKRIGHPLDIVHAVMFLCSEESSFINGQNLIVDGGMTKLMIYHGDQGWSYNPENTGT
jgi:NAD(P)-dependent dehydrogenase (short-subunit alcohol dehydrogenase family)